MSTAFTRFHNTAVVLLLASGCRSDDVVAPARGPLSLTAGFEQIPGGTVTIPIRDSSVSDAGVPLPYLPRRVLLRATLTGTVDIRRTPYNPADGPLQPGAPRTVGPPGYYYGPPQYGPDIQ